MSRHPFKYGRDGICVTCNRPEEHSLHQGCDHSNSEVRSSGLDPDWRECVDCGALWKPGSAPIGRVNLPDAELQRAVSALREVGAIGAAVELADGRVLVFRGGPFGTVEIMPSGSVSIVANGLQARDVV